MKTYYLKKADENFPQLHEESIMPAIEPETLFSGDKIVIDLGNHYVGYFSFKLDYEQRYLDAPVRMYIKFCESARELEDDFSDYHGWLCRSWLEEEWINVDFPGVYEMPRRYAARYIEITIAATPRRLILSNFTFKAVTSANIKQLKHCVISDAEFLAIDKVAVNTLKNCMQRVFEDGPKRDRRLWSGDLHLEALTNYYTFENLELVKRCLYLFAASDTNDKGFIPAYIYENPKFVSGSWFLEDYALLFVASVCHYCKHTRDKDTFDDLYPVVKKQMDAMHNTLDGDGIVTVPDGCDAFIDWCEGLKKITALHGVYLYALNELCELLCAFDMDDDRAVYENRIETAKKCALDTLYDKNKNMFVNQKDENQCSVHSAVWMILGGVVSGKTASTALSNALNDADGLKPFTPYMHHYVVEAMIKIGLLAEAGEYIKNYWGGMVKGGADTFYEVYVPDDADFSPYYDRKINSMCHAWSCTPSYFIRKYFLTKG